MTDPAAGHELVLDLPVSPGAIDEVQDALARFWELDGAVTMLDRIRFESALVEIVGNAVEHAYAFDSTSGGVGRALEVRLLLDAARVEAEVSDNGLPVEIDLGQVTMPGEDAESGRGLALALAAVDDMRYERSGGRNRWVLVCRRDQA
ncbi:ATP-binding protein [Nocardioides aestuarii]|uniref:ATP-binding protein n=1 Tax=Nocardioides aestuarii TaxID=252231 RepID=A0ABW4TTJ3_9ACTN